MNIKTCPFKWNGGSGTCQPDQCALYDEGENCCCLLTMARELRRAAMLCETKVRLGG